MKVAYETKSKGFMGFLLNNLDFGGTVIYGAWQYVRWANQPPSSSIKGIQSIF